MKQRRTFREINDEIERLCSEGIEVPDTDEFGELITPVDTDENYLEQALNELQLDREEKVIDIGEYCLFLKSEDERLGKEIKRIQAWQNRVRGRRTWLLWYCLQEMARAGIRKVQGAFLSVSRRNSPVSATYVRNADGEPDVHQIDPNFVRTVVEHKVDAKGAIKQYNQLVKAAEEKGEPTDNIQIVGFDFHTDKEHVRIS